MALSRFQQTFLYRNHWAFRVLDWLYSEVEYTKKELECKPIGFDRIVSKEEAEREAGRNKYLQDINEQKLKFLNRKYSQHYHLEVKYINRKYCLPVPPLKRRFNKKKVKKSKQSKLYLYIAVFFKFIFKNKLRLFIKLFYFKILFSVFLKYRFFLKYEHFVLNENPEKTLHYKSKFLSFRKSTPISKGFKHKNLGIYLKNLVNNNDDLYNENLKNLYNSYCYLLIRLNRKNLFLTLLNNEGNVLCKTNVGASGFKKKVKRTGYAIKGTGKKFIKKIRKSLIKNIFILYKKNIKNFDYNFKNKIESLKIIKKKKYINNLKIKRKKIKKKKIIKKIKINILKKNTKKIVRSRLLWVKIFNNLKKYRIYYYPTLKNIIKNNLRIIFRIKTSLKLWAFRFVVYGLFKKLPWFRGIEFRLPVPHSNSLRLKKKRRV